MEEGDKKGIYIIVKLIWDKTVQFLSVPYT